MGTHDTVTSTELLDGLGQQGNEGAWRQFSTRYESMLMAFVQRSGFREEDARDIVQEALIAFLQAFREGKYNREHGRLRSWLQGIAFNKIREARRNLVHREVQVVDQTDATAFLNRIPDEHQLTQLFDEEWQRAVMTECLQQIRRQVDEQTFQAFELCALKGWAPEEVAEHLSISRNAVYIAKNRVLSRARHVQRKMTEIW